MGVLLTRWEVGVTHWRFRVQCRNPEREAPGPEDLSIVGALPGEYTASDAIAAIEDRLAEEFGGVEVSWVERTSHRLYGTVLRWGTGIPGEGRAGTREPRVPLPRSPSDRQELPER